VKTGNQVKTALTGNKRKSVHWNNADDGGATSNGWTFAQ
jgi:hypothetical protein